MENNNASFALVVYTTSSQAREATGEAPGEATGEVKGFENVLKVR